MDAPKLCQNCQAPLAADAPRGLCPACLMKVAMATGTVAGQEKPGFSPPSTQELGLKFPQLEIIELIGRGGMGAVYKARQKELDRMVALKILPPGVGDDAAFAERFAREAKALARLNHPGIVTIHDFGRADGLYFFVMEFVDGVNLRQLLASARVSPREALAIVPQICDALQFAHDQGIVHRDIKPENILLDRRGRVKVADFGLAKLVESNAPLTPSLSPSDGERVAGRPGEGKTSALTDAGKVMGTPAYMAPEQVEHPADVDHRADIYALGVVFYQMLTGELPGKRIEPPSKKVQIDVRLDEVVMRALEKKPELRYQQVSEVKTMVETIATSPELSSSRREEAQTQAQSKGADWRTWLPFSSPEVREMCAHMNAAERRKTSERSGLYGLWCVATLGAAPSLAMLLPGSASWIVPAMFVLIYIALVPRWLRAQRRFFCSTAWAKAHGYSPERLRLFSFQVADAPQIVLLVILLTALGVLLVSFLRPASTQPLQLHERSQQIVGIQSKATFGPVIEQKMNLDEKGLTDCLDLDLGEVVIPPSVGVVQAWSRRDLPSAVTVSYDRERNETLLIGTGGTDVVALRKDKWEVMRPDEVENATFRDVASSHARVAVRGRGEPPMAFRFKTPLGKTGLLQITGFTDNPRGVKIRYKLVQKAASPPATSVVAQTLSFGPVIERVLYETTTGRDCFLDLETGSLLQPPPQVMSMFAATNWEKHYMDEPAATDPMRAWVWTSGADLVYGAPAFNHERGIIMFDATMIGTEDYWKMGAVQLAKLLQGKVSGTPSLAGVPPVRADQLPRSYAFRTKDGTMGVLQVVSFTDNPRDVKIRYKLVRGSTANVPLAPSPVPATERP